MPFTESSNFPDSVPIIETSDFVIGGSEDSGPNKIVGPVVNRTRYLKNEQDALKTLVQGLIDNQADTIFNLTWPVGSVYIQTSDSRNPNQIFGGRGTWEKYARGQMLVSEADGGPFAVQGNSGGNIEITLSDNQVGVHNHSLDQSNTEHEHRYDRPENLQNLAYQPGSSNINVVTAINNEPTTREQVPVTVSNAGQAAPINVMNPYVVVYMWRRTA